MCRNQRLFFKMQDLKISEGTMNMTIFIMQCLVCSQLYFQLFLLLKKNIINEETSSTLKQDSTVHAQWYPAYNYHIHCQDIRALNALHESPDKLTPLSLKACLLCCHSSSSKGQTYHKTRVSASKIAHAAAADLLKYLFSFLHKIYT